MTETFNEIVIIDQRDDNPEYTDYPAPIHVYESGHETNEDIKIDVREFAHDEYMLQIYHGTDVEDYYAGMDLETGDVYSDQHEELLMVEIETMSVEEIRRLARLLNAAADYLEEDKHND